FLLALVYIMGDSTDGNENDVALDVGTIYPMVSTQRGPQTYVRRRIQNLPQPSSSAAPRSRNPSPSTASVQTSTPSVSSTAGLRRSARTTTTRGGTTSLADRPGAEPDSTSNKMRHTLSSWDAYTTNYWKNVSMSSDIFGALESGRYNMAQFKEVSTEKFIPFNPITRQVEKGISTESARSFLNTVGCSECSDNMNAKFLGHNNFRFGSLEEKCEIFAKEIDKVITRQPMLIMISGITGLKRYREIARVSPRCDIICVP
ncbi:hypothetical protein PFISCL1PPCAC_5328, partial [Pristionchus fissidentatus]